MLVKVIVILSPVLIKSVRSDERVAAVAVNLMEKGELGTGGERERERERAAAASSSRSSMQKSIFFQLFTF